MMMLSNPTKMNASRQNRIGNNRMSVSDVKNIQVPLSKKIWWNQVNN